MECPHTGWVSVIVCPIEQETRQTCVSFFPKYMRETVDEYALFVTRSMLAAQCRLMPLQKELERSLRLYKNATGMLYHYKMTIHPCLMETGASVYVRAAMAMLPEPAAQYWYSALQ